MNRFLSKIISVLLCVTVLAAVPPCAFANGSKASISTGDYLTEAEARCFLGFLFNTSDYTEADYSDYDIYKLMTGQLSGEEEIQAGIQFLILEKGQLAATSSRLGSIVNASSEILVEYLSSQVTDDIAGAVAGEIVNEVLHNVANSGLEYVTDTYLRHGNDLDGMSYENFWDAKIAWDTVKDVVDIRKKVKEYTDKLVAFSRGVFYVAGSNRAEMYDYYLSYRDNLWFKYELGEDAFKLAMDTNALCNERLAVIKALEPTLANFDFLDEHILLWATEDRIALMERWAEWSYCLEEKIDDAYGPVVGSESDAPEDIPSASHPVGDKVSGNWEYSLVSNTVRITKYLGAAPRVVIPSSIDGYEVTRVESGVFAAYQPANVYVSDTVKTISNGAFQLGMSALVLDGSPSIGSQAFENCTVIASEDLIASTVSMNGGSLVVEGDLDVTSKLSVEENVSINVLGDASFAGIEGSGSVEIKGSLSRDNGKAFDISGNADVVVHKSANVACRVSGLSSVEVKGDLEASSGLVVAEKARLCIRGDASFPGLSGPGSAEVGGDFAWAGRFELSGGGSLDVKGSAEIGNYYASGRDTAGCHLTGGSSLDVFGDAALYAVSMSGGDNLVRVRGDLDLTKGVSQDYSSGYGRASGGSLELMGDLALGRVGYEPSGSHKTVFCGSGPQTVTGAGTSQCYLGNVVNAHEDESEMSGCTYEGKYVHDPSYKTGDRYVQFATLGTSKYPCTGEEVDLDLRYGSTALQKGVDYRIVGDNKGDSLGSAVVSVEGMGLYKGKADFKITIAQDMAAAVIEPIPDQSYTGKTATPAVVVKFGAETLAKGTDYAVSYANNKNAGTATVTVTGKGNFVGTLQTDFQITKASNSAEVSNMGAWVIGGKTAKPKASSDFGSATLSYSHDGGLSWSAAEPAQSGEWLVKAVVAGSDNWESCESEPVSFEAYELASVPTAAEGLAYDGGQQVGVEGGAGCDVSEDFGAVDAGSYVASVAPSDGFAWADGSRGPVEFPGPLPLRLCPFLPSRPPRPTTECP